MLRVSRKYQLSDFMLTMRFYRITSCSSDWCGECDMGLVVNTAKAALEAGRVSLGVGLRIARPVEVASVMKAAGFDWLFLDLEHGTMPLDTAAQIAAAALTVGIAPLARVPKGEFTMATQLFDNGVQGIVMPHIDTISEAREVVERLRFRPLGHRTSGPLPPQLGFQILNPTEMAAALEPATLIAVLLESREAIANADSIAAIDGIDVLMIGTADLCIEMDIPAQFTHPRVATAFKTVGAACRRHNKWLGMGGIYDEEMIRRYIGLGTRFILSGSDLSFLLSAASSRVRALAAKTS
jgi:2-keto-3-deoxy-L-rhamnonate aldolase RhmA